MGLISWFVTFLAFGWVRGVRRERGWRKLKHSSVILIAVAVVIDYQNCRFRR